MTDDDRLGFVRVPADPEFVIGTPKAAAQRVAEIINADVPDHERNEVISPTPEFYIARYPVTVAQFKAFVKAKLLKVGDDRALRDPDNRPVRWVSWLEALAYCDWLNDCLAHSPAFEGSEMARRIRESGWRVTLPSELEWEKAARGGLRDAVFAWGDDPDPNRANYEETGIGDTSTVGCFLANGFGLHDLLGNVWEWTRSLWGHDWKEPEFGYPYDPDDARRENLAAGNDILRVLRGGSWRDRRAGARCAYRGRSRPDGHRYDSNGFRVVLRSAPVS